MIGLDHRLERWVAEHRVSWLDQVFVWISNIGAFGWIFLAIALAAAVLLRRPQVLLLTLVAAAVAELLSRGLKAAIDRERPHLPPGEPVLATAIAYSRVYLGVHYPLDVIVGAALGAAVATALRLLAGAPRRPLRAPRPG